MCFRQAFPDAATHIGYRYMLLDSLSDLVARHARGSSTWAVEGWMTMIWRGYGSE